MSRGKQGLALVLAVAVLALGALLPGWAAAVQDRQEARTLETLDILALTVQTREGTLPERLLMLSGVGIELLKSQTAWTRDEAIEIAYSTVERYAAVMADYPIDTLEVEHCLPLLYTSEAVDGLSGVVWYVQLQGTQLDQTVTLQLDERTGVALEIRLYMSETASRQTMGPAGEQNAAWMQEQAQRLYEHYMEEVVDAGLEPGEVFNWNDVVYRGEPVTWYSGTGEVLLTQFVDSASGLVVQMGFYCGPDGWSAERY